MVLGTHPSCLPIYTKSQRYCGLSYVPFALCWCALLLHHASFQEGVAQPGTVLLISAAPLPCSRRLTTLIIVHSRSVLCQRQPPRHLHLMSTLVLSQRSELMEAFSKWLCRVVWREMV